jgi:uncharacterized membrane protein SirB2
MNNNLSIDLTIQRRKIMPQIRALVLCLLGLGIVVIVKINLNEAQVGDLVVKLNHNNIYTRVQVPFIF